ncbi:MAG: hypothetical protein KDD33_00125 [Bdellovibrionales bacterium]|nr:hypothetical protein [Bdellovibrionales bacterium]
MRFVGFLFLISILLPHDLWAACGANTRTWQANAGTTNWNTNNNWTPANRPNTATENAVIVSDWTVPAYPGNNYTLGCVEIQSGSLTVTNNNILTIGGDYFRNINPGSLTVGGANTWEVVMAGTADQTFENVDLIPRLRINNANTVTLTHPFSIRNRFLVDAGSGFVIIEGDLETQQTGAFTIESGVEFTLASGVTWTLNGNLVIDGTLHMESGSKLNMANGTSLTVSASGTLDINGTAGNAVTIMAEDSSSNISFTVAGLLDAQYLVLNYLDATGVAMNGSISRFDNVSINAIESGGAAMTIGAAASLTSGMDNVGFYGDSGGGPFTNVNASAYSGSSVSFSNWSGLGDTANENDPNTVINWGTEATPVLQVQNVSGAGVPPASIAKGAALTQFATFAFSMSGTAATATNVTSLTLTLDGSNLNSDVANIAVYEDTNANCSYDGGTDTLIGNYTPTGSPGTITVNMSGEINVIDTTQDCLHVAIATSANATTGNTIGVSIESTDDISNDQSYGISDTTGPPVNPGVAPITGTAVSRWNGGYSNNMFTTGNWTPNTVPTNAIDCEIGTGYQPPRMTAAFNCLNTKFQSTGSINWNNTTNAFNIYGAWVIENGFVFSNSNNAIVNLVGSTDQSVFMGSSTFPNDVTVNSSGTVTFEDTGVISGNLTLSGGGITIASGASLQVTGNVSVASGTTLDIEPGGELVMGNGSTITVNSGGTFEIVGSVAQSAGVRAVNDSSSYTVTINNGATISARYYSFRNLGLTGLTVNATATIDGSNFLQNGTFIYPGVASANMLRLFQEIPGDVLDGMSFESDGSGAGSVISIYTSTGATSDTLSLTNFAGDLTGATYTNDNNYLVVWGTPTNELKLTQEATAPASSAQGDVVNMGRFGFQQLNAGSFNDTDIDYIRITLTGTGSSSDVDSVMLYYDASCSGSGGTLLGTKSFSGNPARAEFTSLSGVTVEADVATPPLRCVYVVFNLNALATNGKTVGAEITSSLHVTNSEAFDFNASFAPPVNLGTTSIVGSTTQWTGATSTNWFTAGNWSGGVPTSGLNCIINEVANDPVIGSGTAVCKSVSIGNGNLTISGGSLEVYGSLESTGTITASAPIVIRDDGATPTSQNIDVTSSLSEIQFNKTAGGAVNINSDLNLTNQLVMDGSQDFTLTVTGNNALILNAGLSLSGGVFDMEGASELQLASGQSVSVTGGTFRTSGTNDAFPQTLTNKAHITNTGGSSTWSFSASSGTVDLTGFYIDWLDTSGLNLTGTVTLSHLDGGQLRNLPTTAGMTALQINTSGSIPATSSNFGWNWGPTNSPPSEATAYFLGASTGCGSQTIDFDQWFGDFWPFTTATTADKISTSGCTILIDRAKSPVSLTQLEAEPFDSKVVIRWTTGNEWDHRGFNVYRSLKPEDSYVQINNELIRNDLFSTNIHGTYAFVDEGVINGQTYYYMLEDVSLMGESTLHGPLSALPAAGLGDPPAITAGTIASSSDQNGAGDSDSSGGDTVEISENVWVLAQTDSYLRLKIVIPALSLTADPLNGSYSQLSINGYSRYSEAGAPQLLSKTLFIPIDGNSSSATFELVDAQTQVAAGVKVSPAPRYVASGDSMVPQWELNSTIYSTAQSMPDQFIELANIVVNQGQSYLPIVVNPVRYNPVSLDLTKANELVLDVFLEGAPAWQNPQVSVSPWMREGSIKIGWSKEGMYSVSFDELYEAGVVAPVAGKDISHLHLRVASVDLGISVDSADSVFNSGDSILFYAPYLKTDEDSLTYGALYFDDSLSSSLASQADASVGVLPATTSSGFTAKNHYEQNNLAVFNEPYTEQTDHFVWSLIYGVSGGARTGLSFDVQLPHLQTSGEVVLRATVKGRVANSVNTHHNLEIYVNDSASAVAQASFYAVEPQSLVFKIPVERFASGLNKVELQATGNNLPAGEYDMLYVDDVEIFYPQQWAVDGDQALILDQQQGFSYSLDGFTQPSIKLYDVSSPSALVEYVNFATAATSNGFAVDYGVPASVGGRRLWVGTTNQFHSASSFKLIEGSRWSDSNHQADVVYIGHKDLLKSVKALGDLRESQGYKVEYINLESLYDEFGNGLHNVQAVKDFVDASQNWQLPPRYYVLLGDGTYDPKGFQNDIIKYRFPIKYMSGVSFDYASDHWFVANEQGIPQAVVARIPAHSLAQMEIYVQKVLDYESGARKPGALAAMTFVSDKPQYTGEDFETPIGDIQSLSEVSKITNVKEQIKRSELSDAEMKSALVDAFANSSVVHYMGHGAENMWGGSSVFENADASALTNSKLPIVVAMSCLNAQYTDPDLTSFSEELLFNPQGGAIAFWGSTTFTPPSIQDIYQQSFYRNLAQSAEQDLGEIVKMSKVEAGLSSPHDEVLYSWSIIGDPLLKPAIQIQSSNASTSPVNASPSSGTSPQGGGCSAIASSQGGAGQGTPWALVISFIFEVLMVLLVMKLSKVLARHSLKKD